MIKTNFSGLRALVVHRADHHRDALSTQLSRFGLHVTAAAPATSLRGQVEAADVVFFDADAGHDDLFPWPRGMAPMPLVAILASEAPGRLEWALGQSVTGFIIKPIGSSGAYQALLVATQLHQQLKEMRRLISSLSERLQARPIVVRAIIELMRCHGLDEARSYDRLRLAAMASRQSIEELATSIVATPSLAAKITTPNTDTAKSVQSDRSVRRHN